MLWREQDAGGRLVVRFRGALDAASAREIVAVVGGEPERQVTLDLCQATRIDPCALAALVAELLRRRNVPLLRGLCESHLRLLRYFGLDLARFGIEEAHQLDVE